VNVRKNFRYTPATSEAGEVLIDSVDTAQLGGWLVVVLPDLFRRSASGRSCCSDSIVVMTHANV
jgi:hypothetical protein